ncbi:hypothetical protein GCM10010177_33080 [Actinomadura citrea]|nr:hypothetical protein GCM10010177_33080 [Actinomadura citrea]
MRERSTRCKDVVPIRCGPVGSGKVSWTRPFRCPDEARAAFPAGASPFATATPAAANTSPMVPAAATAARSRTERRLTVLESALEIIA